MTRRERNDVPVRSTRQAPPSVVVRRPETGKVKTRRSAADGAVPRRSAPSARPLKADPDTDDLIGARHRKRNRVFQLAAAVGALGASIVLVGWVVLFGLHRMAGHQVVEETHAVLASGVFRTVQELEAS